MLAIADIWGREGVDKGLSNLKIQIIISLYKTPRRWSSIVDTLSTQFLGSQVLCRLKSAQIHLLSAFSVSGTWQSPAWLNIIAALIFVLPFLFQCLFNDHLALAFSSGMSSYILRWLSEWLSCHAPVLLHTVQDTVSPYIHLIFTSAWLPLYLHACKSLLILNGTKDIENELDAITIENKLEDSIAIFSFQSRFLQTHEYD